MPVQICEQEEQLYSYKMYQQQQQNWKMFFIFLRCLFYADIPK